MSEATGKTSLRRKVGVNGARERAIERRRTPCRVKEKASRRGRPAIQTKKTASQAKAIMPKMALPRRRCANISFKVLVRKARLAHIYIACQRAKVWEAMDQKGRARSRARARESQDRKSRQLVAKLAVARLQQSMPCSNIGKASQSVTGKRTTTAFPLAHASVIAESATVSLTAIVHSASTSFPRAMVNCWEVRKVTKLLPSN
mmetsp:Transcript_65932/g.159353  ORF Transcript_65932/g.159353 Transcript_65932/m.159353 type:complete len:203 (+) Transcript_65932:154-762(+)